MKRLGVEIAAIEARLGDPATYQNGEAFKALLSDQAYLRRELEQLETSGWRNRPSSKVDTGGQAWRLASVGILLLAGGAQPAADGLDLHRRARPLRVLARAAHRRVGKDP